jgi:uncharacterized protein YlzI (FlbEa/FlbD family)
MNNKRKEILEYLCKRIQSEPDTISIHINGTTLIIREEIQPGAIEIKEDNITIETSDSTQIIDLSENLIISYNEEDNSFWIKTGNNEIFIDFSPFTA